jgi:hypothetical protein
MPCLQAVSLPVSPALVGKTFGAARAQFADAVLLGVIPGAPSAKQAPGSGGELLMRVLRRQRSYFPERASLSVRACGSPSGLRRSLICGAPTGGGTLFGGGSAASGVTAAHASRLTVCTGGPDDARLLQPYDRLIGFAHSKVSGGGSRAPTLGPARVAKSTEGQSAVTLRTKRLSRNMHVSACGPAAWFTWC